MLIIYGTRTKLKIDRSLGVQTCPNCQNLVEMSLAREKHHAHIMYIPVFFWTGWKVKACPNCGVSEILSGSEYSALKKGTA